MTASEVRILLVEDNRADVYLFEAALREEGIASHLDVAEDGLTGWQLISSCVGNGTRRPDLIVLDLNLPGMSGRQILGEVVKRPALADIPICIFTGAESEHSVVDEFPTLRLCFEAKTENFAKLLEVARRFLAFAGIHQ